MEKVLIYNHGNQKGSTARKTSGEGIDCAVANTLDDLSGHLQTGHNYDLLILDSVPKDLKPTIIKRIKKIKDIPVVMFEERAAAERDSSQQATDRVSNESIPELLAASSNPMEIARQFMDDHFRKALTLEEIAMKAGISPSYFCRKFKTCYGESPITYLRNLRIARACYLLEHTNLNLSDITQQSGFFSVSYFCREFKKATGVSPIQHRRKNSKKSGASPGA